MIRPFLLALICTIAFGVSTLRAQEKFLDKSLDGWAAQLLNGENAKLRRDAGFALGKIGFRAASATGVMKNAYAREKDVKVREAIIFALAEISRESPPVRNDAELETLFLGAITSNDAYLRRSAAFGLGCLATKSAACQAALENALGDQKAIVRQNAAWAIGQFGEKALPALRKALTDSDSLVKRDAAGALMQVADPDKVRGVLKELAPLCRDNNSEVRRAALNVLVRIVDRTDKEAIPALKWALQDRDIENKRNAALALSNIGGEETAIAIPTLLDAAKNGDEELRRQSVIALRNIGPAAKTAIPDLIGFLNNDKDPKMREYAALALSGMVKMAEPAIPALVAKLKDADETRDTRVACAMALARIGSVPTAIKAAPTLLDILGDPRQDAKVRERSMWALRVHQLKLRDMAGTKETFARVINEPVNDEIKMLRYDCAYMLGMIWQQDAPGSTLTVLDAFLRDKEIKVYESTTSAVEGNSAESKKGTASVKEQGKGDGRVMAANALQAMGPGRYAKNAQIMAQLKLLADDNATYAPLRKKAAALIKAAQ